MRQVTLPSGAILKVAPAPFAPAWALYQAIVDELKSVQVNIKMDKLTLFKDLFCYGFTSKAVEACLWECLQRCTYADKRGELKVDKDTFEPIEARQDVMDVYMEVAKENVTPFANRLYAEYVRFVTTMAVTPKST